MKTEGANAANTTSSSSSSTTMTSSSSSSNTSRVPLTLRDFFFQDPFFQSSWEDFDKIRENMIKESQSFWAKARADSAALMQTPAAGDKLEMPSLSAATAPDMSLDSQLLAPMILPRRWMLPRFLSRDETEKAFPSDFFNFKKENENVLRVKDDDKSFELSLDTHEYRPDELKVNVSGNTLTVEAKHEEKSDNKFVSRQFSRKYTLPEGCEAHNVNSNLSSDGILMITAPKKAAIKVEDGARAVPIEMKK